MVLVGYSSAATAVLLLQSVVPRYSSGTNNGNSLNYVFKTWTGMDISAAGSTTGSW